MRVTFFVALASVAFAQQQYSIDPNNVNMTTRALWCNGQTTTCPLICLQLNGSQGAEANTCNPDNLTYNCVCTNGQSPNLTEYTQTMPYYICTEWGNECVANCGNDNTCQSACRQQHPCGAQAPKKAVTSSTTSSASHSSTGSATSTSAAGTTLYNGLAGATTTPSTGASPNIRPLALELGQAWGMAVIVAGLFGGFAILL